MAPVPNEKIFSRKRLSTTKTPILQCFFQDHLFGSSQIFAIGGLLQVYQIPGDVTALNVM